MVTFVLTVSSADGNIEFSEVITFLKKRHTGITMYKSINISGNRTICLTGNHIIYSRKYSTEMFNKK